MIHSVMKSQPAVTVDLGSLPRLGVGVLYNPALPDFLRHHLEMVDYLEVIPDMFWTDHGIGQPQRFTETESWIEFLDWMAERRPIIAHNTGLSIGSADIFDHAYVEQIATWQSRYHFPWHSDHLSFVKVRGAGGHAHSTALALPIPYDEEALTLVAERIRVVQQTVPVPFLLENNVYYVDLPEQDMTEPQFLNRLAAETQCGLLLDVHNLYANARNHRFDPCSFLDNLNLSAVVEIHVAGGNELAGMYTDSHAGPCPPPVWDLLNQVVPHAPNLCGVTFEFHESYYPLLKTEGILNELSAIRKAWSSRASTCVVCR